MRAYVRKAVVTGGEGFIGRELILTLLAEGYRVESVDNRTNVPMRIDNTHLRYHQVDVRSQNMLSRVCVGADIIFHLASAPVCHDPFARDVYMHVNTYGTMCVMSAAAAARVRRVVFASSSAVYGEEALPFEEHMEPRPTTSYGYSKAIAEHFASAYACTEGVPLETVSLRYFNVYGERMRTDNDGPSVMGRFLYQHMHKLSLTIYGAGNQERDFVHVRDAAMATMLAGVSPHVGHGEVINIGTGIPRRVRELAALIGGHVEYTDIHTQCTPYRSYANTHRAKALLDWKSTITLENGLERVKRYLHIE